MIDNNSILKILLEADADPNDPNKQPNEKPKKPEGFEEDPMGFIIRKYHGLHETLKELMSDDFKQYLTAIFVVAPKPTTFKIILHNGQFFFITYMGKPMNSSEKTLGIYEANIAGKRYYLNNIGVKERAMEAITRLLKFGDPLKSKGPEGAEQGTRPESGGGSTGGGGGETETPETGGEGGGENTEAGGEESLKESIMEINLLKNLLLITNEKFFIKNQKIINELIKEVYLTSNNKNLFMKKNQLQEVAAPKLKAVLLKQLKDAGYVGKPSSKHGAHLRFNLESPTEAENIIKKMLSGISKEKFYKIQKIAPGDYANGAKSGDYDTYKIEITKPVAGLEAGDETFVANQITEKGSIVQKALTPGKLKLPGHRFTDENQLASYVSNQLPSTIKNPELIKALDSLMNDIAENAETKFKNVSDIIEHTDIVELDEETKNLLKSFTSTDLNIIGKDFGEVLGAIAMLKSVQNAGSGVEFPAGENNPLADFSIDGYNISSKYQAGASATLTAIIKNIDPKKQLKGKQDQIELYEILKSVVLSGVAESYVNVGKAIDSKGLKVLAKCLGMSVKQVNPESINQMMSDLFKGKNDQKKDALLHSTFDDFYNTIGRSPKKGGINWAKLGSNYYGLVLSPLAYSVVDELNANPKYKKALKDILSKIDVKQLYLDFNLKSNSATFKLKNFASADFKFATSISVYNPTNSKLSFTLIK